MCVLEKVAEPGRTGGGGDAGCGWRYEPGSYFTLKLEKAEEGGRGRGKGGDAPEVAEFVDERLEGVKQRSPLDQ